jgi:(p)ppGpp synthase/HD superfamily hydrolase
MRKKMNRPSPDEYVGIENPLQRAISIAVTAHQNQTDKGGNPYILHPLRVMMSLRTDEEMIVGVLHDVIEDCAEDGFDWNFLEKCDFSSVVLQALITVTKTPEEEKHFKSLSGQDRIDAYLEFVSRAKSNPIGRRVKRADIFDNLNVSRIGELTQKDLERLNQYKKAIEFLDS